MKIFRLDPKTATVKDKISWLIRNYRLSTHLTQVDLSRLLGISQSCLSKIESGKLEPSASMWLHFCVIVGISPKTPLQKNLGLNQNPAKQTQKAA